MNINKTHSKEAARMLSSLANRIWIQAPSFKVNAQISRKTLLASACKYFPFDLEKQ
jgi:hypothetical protein